MSDVDKFVFVRATWIIILKFSMSCGIVALIKISETQASYKLSSILMLIDIFLH